MVTQTGACEPMEQSLDHEKHLAIMSTRRVGAMGLRQCLLENTRRTGDQGNDIQAISLMSGCGRKDRTGEAFQMAQRQA